MKTYFWSDVKRSLRKDGAWRGYMINLDSAIFFAETPSLKKALKMVKEHGLKINEIRNIAKVG